MSHFKDHKTMSLFVCGMIRIYDIKKLQKIHLTNDIFLLAFSQIVNKSHKIDNYVTVLDIHFTHVL